MIALILFIVACGRDAVSQVKKLPSLTLKLRLYDGTRVPISEDSSVHLNLEGVRTSDDKPIAKEGRGSSQLFFDLPGYGNLTMGDLLSGVMTNKSLEQIFGSGLPRIFVEQSNPHGYCEGTEFETASIELDYGNSKLERVPDGLTESADMMIIPCRHQLDIASWEKLSHDYPDIASILRATSPDIDARTNYDHLRLEHPDRLCNILNQLWLLSQTRISSRSAISYIQAVDWKQPVTASDFTVIVPPGTANSWGSSNAGRRITVLDDLQPKQRSNLLRAPKAFQISWREAGPTAFVLSEDAFSVKLYREMWQVTRFRDIKYSPPFAVGRRIKLTVAEAIADGNLEQLVEYLTAGGDPNAAEHFYGSLVENAASHDRLDMVKLLLEYGASSASDFTNAVTEACSHKQQEIVVTLFPKLDPSKLLDHNGVLASCLSSAVENNDSKLVGYLSDNADISPLMKSRKGEQLITNAVSLPDTSVANLLLKEGAPLQTGNAGGISYDLRLMEVAATNSPEMVGLLLQRGADPNEGGGEPLRRAAELNRPDIVRFLINHGARLDVQRNSALIVAAYRGYPEVVKVLLESKADPNIQDQLGYSPLIMASLHGQVEIVSLLLTHGAKVDLAAKNGILPLIAAAEEGSRESIALLLSHGADSNIRFAGKTPREIAQKRYNSEATVLLGGKPTPSPPASTKSGAIDMSIAWPPERLEALHSFLFQNTFLLRDTAIDALPLGLTASELRILNEQLSGVLSALLLMLQHRSDYVTQRTGTTVKASYPISLNVIDGGFAGAWASSSGCGHSGNGPEFCIIVDAKLLRANLVASLVKTRPELSLQSSKEQFESVQNQLRWLRNSINNVFLGSPLDAGDLPLNFEYDTPKIDPWPAADDLQIQYYGTLLFTIAHELGHVVLEHFQKLPASCAERELQADQFAAVLVGESFVAQSIDYLGGVAFFSEDRLLAYAGWATFLDYAYEYAGFRNNNATCIYPSQEVRRSHALSEFMLISDNDAKTFVARIRKRGSTPASDLISPLVAPSYRNP
jgi:ankyrin repeat protein